MTHTQDEGLLARWSRRKQQSTLVSEKEDLDLELQVQGLDIPESDQPDPESAGEPEVPELTDADMPSIDTLTEESDFSGFMSSGVSDKLRNLALRKLFGAPSFNIRDGLDEYDEDYTYFEKLGDIVTADMKHRIEMEEAEKREQQVEDAAAQEEQAEGELAGESDVEAVEQEEQDSDSAEIESETGESENGMPESDAPMPQADPEIQKTVKSKLPDNTTKKHD